MRQQTRGCFGTLLLAVPLAVHADWPAWRGPDSNAYIAESSLPAQIDPQANLLWKVDLPGPGASTPIHTAGAIYVTCEIDGQDALVGYDSQGDERWRCLLGPTRSGRHRNATGANPSAVTDGATVFAYFKSGRLAAVSTEGERLWQRELQDDFGADTLWWDLGTSPILTPAGVLIAVLQAGDSYLVTFDPADGSVVWKQQRVFERPEESDQAYTTPILTTTEHGPTIVVWGADHVTGHDTETGAELFRCGGFNPSDTPMWRAIASATVAGDKLIVPYGRADFVGAMRLGGVADTTAEQRLWTTQGVGSDVPCAVIAGGRAYLLGDKGVVACLDIETGDELWRTKLPRSKNKYFASPLLAGTLMYCFREDGAGFVLRVADDGAEVIDECDLGETLVASPVPLGDDRLLVRTREALYCFGG
ncbi:MAG: PQQ-binding-like beta-propeller repeat protein [Planctomycetota bacterium]